MKKIFNILIITSMIVLLTTACGNNKKEEIKKDSKVKVNTNENITKDQSLDVFSFTNTSLVYENQTSILTTKVTNKSNKTEYLKEFKIIVKDENGNTIITLPGYVGDNIEAKSSVMITSSCGEDLSKAISIDYETVR